MVFVKTEMVAKGISQDDIPENLGWEMGQQIISDEDHDCFGKLTNQFASEGSLIFLPNISEVYFQEQIGFVLKMIIFSYMA